MIRLSAIKTQRKAPLSGLRVLDLSRILAGPYATMMLGDMGAEIVKVERPIYGDDTRSWGPPFTKMGNESAYFLSVNRNKKSVVVDLKTDEGLRIIKALARKSDIVVENFAPGDAKKLGLDRDEFRILNQNLIWCSITGYGPDGPLANRLGYAVLVEAHAGLMNATGPRNGDPVKCGVALTDIITGLHASTAILAAVHNRWVTGKGCVIDCSLLESQVSAMANIAANYLIAGQEAERLGTDHASIVPYGCLKAQNGMIAIGAGNDKQFYGLAKCLGIPEIAGDVRFSTNASRVKNRIDLITRLEDRLRDRTKEEWMTLFDQVPETERFAFAPVNTMRQVFEDPQVLHRRMVVEVSHRTAGHIKVPGPAVKFPGFEMNPLTPPPVLGEHTDEVLERFLEGE